MNAKVGERCKKNTKAKESESHNKTTEGEKEQKEERREEREKVMVKKQNLFIYGCIHFQDELKHS